MASLLSALSLDTSCQETPISSQFKTPPPKDLPSSPPPLRRLKYDNHHSRFCDEYNNDEEMNIIIKKNINDEEMNLINIKKNFIIDNFLLNKMNLPPVLGESDIPPFPSLGHDNTTSVVSRVSHDVEEVD
jgi:hypothetical protein